MTNNRKPFPRWIEREIRDIQANDRAELAAAEDDAGDSGTPANLSEIGLQPMEDALDQLRAATSPTPAPRRRRKRQS